jgi:hypothetical protein
MEPTAGVAPATTRVQTERSTTELCGHIKLLCISDVGFLLCYPAVIRSVPLMRLTHGATPLFVFELALGNWTLHTNRP